MTGRPPATNHDAIARVALDLFIKDGYDAVTMDNIAVAAGISRTTLWRYYRTKGEVLWVHREERLARLRATLAAQPPGMPVAEGAVGAWRTSVAVRPEQVALEKARLRFAVKVPSTATSIWTTYRSFGRAFVEYVASRRGGSPDDAENQAIGMMIWAALWTASEQWAFSEDASPDAHYDRVLTLLQGLAG